MTRGRRSRARRVFLLGAALGACATLCIWPWIGAPRAARLDAPPEVELGGADPAAADAIRAARERVRAAPASADAWGRLGMVLLAHDAHRAAIACLEQAALRDGADPRWPYLEGVAHTKGNPDPPAATRAFERAASLSGAAPVVHVRLAEHLIEQGDYDRARAELERALAASPQDARALAALGRIAYLRGDLAEARKELQASAAAAQRARSTRALLAEVLNRLGDRASAEGERRALAGLPESYTWPDPYWQQVVDLWTGALAAIDRGTDLQARGQGTEAVQVLRDAAARYPQALLVHLSLGRMLAQAGDAPGAESAFGRAAEIAPESFEARFELGSVLASQGKTREAARAFAETLERKPDYPPAHYQLAQCRVKLGDVAGAVESLRAAVRYRPSYATAHHELGALLLKTGAREEGLASLRSALELNPADAEARKVIEAAGGR